MRWPENQSLGEVEGYVECQIQQRPQSTLWTNLPSFTKTQETKSNKKCLCIGFSKHKQCFLDRRWSVRECCTVRSRWEEWPRKHTIHKTHMQKRFHICTFGNKQMTQEVSLAWVHCLTIWELKGGAPQPFIPVQRTDGLSQGAVWSPTHLSLRTMANSLGILALSEPKPKVPSLFIAPNPSLYTLFPWCLLSLGDSEWLREGGLQMVAKHYVSWFYVTLVLFSKNLPEVSPVEIATVIQTSFLGLKKSPFYRLTSCLHFFNVHSVCIQSLVPLSVPVLQGPLGLQSLLPATPKLPFCKASLRRAFCMKPGLSALALNDLALFSPW